MRVEAPREGQPVPSQHSPTGCHLSPGHREGVRPTGRARERKDVETDASTWLAARTKQTASLARRGKIANPREATEFAARDQESRGQRPSSLRMRLRMNSFSDFTRSSSCPNTDERLDPIAPTGEGPWPPRISPSPTSSVRCAWNNK